MLLQHLHATENPYLIRDFYQINRTTSRLQIQTQPCCLSILENPLQLYIDDYTRNTRESKYFPRFL